MPPRDEHGRFFSGRCIHDDCDGELRSTRDAIDGVLVWYCDGLRPMGPDKELDACNYAHVDGSEPDEQVRQGER